MVTDEYGEDAKLMHSSQISGRVMKNGNKGKRTPCGVLSNGEMNLVLP
ncbi:hypothetical protein KNP414_04199 [Paenibacillus mucilaginosus KNP414]|uniref:Uncharacterized protein n=1 Tax=Paenibacillus mucilaginosus (strain KNP414) TaxID=1036673 RepID=F8FFV4_PAEMK|nr:hypothetical protein KNP414_04199 [Paenibacillus mucilaginosus KNP414]